MATFGDGFVGEKISLSCAAGVRVYVDLCGRPRLGCAAQQLLRNGAATGSAAEES